MSKFTPTHWKPYPLWVEQNENENEVLFDDEDELDDEFKEHRKNLDLERFKSYLRSNVEMIVKSIRTRKVKELKRKFGIAMIFRV